ncbi:hypothetical protein BT69DRAFT_1290022, partial [Atractiella rhizophila]
MYAPSYVLPKAAETDALHVVRLDHRHRLPRRHQTAHRDDDEEPLAMFGNRFKMLWLHPSHESPVGADGR